MNAVPPPARKPATVTDPRPPIDASDEALAAAVAPADDPSSLLTLDELAAATELSPALLRTVVREGFLRPRETDPDRFSVADAETVRIGLRLVDAGLPLAEFLDLARRTDEAMRPIAEHAVELFARFVRDPVLGSTEDESEAAARLLDAYQTMLPATEQLVGDHFQQLLLAAARDRFEREPS